MEANGLVEIKRGALGGALVCKRDFSNFAAVLNHLMCTDQFELRDIYQARLLFEPGMVGMAARVASKADVSTLRSCIQYHRQIPSDHPAAIGRNFHYLLAVITANPLLVLFMNPMLSVAQMPRAQQPLASRKRRLVAHEKIVDAIEWRNGPEGRSIMEDHLRRFLGEVIREAAS